MLTAQEREAVASALSSIEDAIQSGKRRVIFSFVFAMFDDPADEECAPHVGQFSNIQDKENIKGLLNNFLATMDKQSDVEERYSKEGLAERKGKLS